jgi:arginase
MRYDIQIVSAPSILGLKPTGVEDLGQSLLRHNLRERLLSEHPVLQVPTLNSSYTTGRDTETNCINAAPIKEFSFTLGSVVLNVIEQSCFPLVLGGDCSILIGIMAALKRKGTYGLLFMDAHADFYLPEQSPTGEVADMELAIVTGRGPDLLTNIDQLKPYVRDANVIHIGQRDQAQTKEYRSFDIRDTPIHCVDASTLQSKDLKHVTADLIAYGSRLSDVKGFWLHFDTDVLADDINPAVDYRLPGGLLADEAEYLMRTLLKSKQIIGMSVTIYNPRLDINGRAGEIITDTLVNAFTLRSGTK